MEAVPKLPLISFELKISPESTQFGPKLKQYITEAYREDPDAYGNELYQLETLRNVAVRPTTDDAGLGAMSKYFCQLQAMQSRFPMAKGQPAAVTFAWKDLYANMSCSLSDVRFEKACILYNIGAMHTQLGSSEPRTTPESLKSCLLHYQNAAWAFKYLSDQYPQPPGVDVSTEIMRFLQEVCLAQAQECIMEKSIQDTKKPSVVGAVATQVLLFYKNSLALLGPSTGTDNIHEIIGTKLYNYWYRYLSFKSSYIGCIVCLYQGMNAEEQQKMGERVAFYQHALDRLNEARKLTKYIEPKQVTEEALTFTNDVVEGKRKAAKNENEFIYHEEVPDKDLLTDLKPVCLVKPMPINFSDPEVSGTDLFARLIPIGAHEASSLYSEEKAKLLRNIAAKAETKDTELTEFMSSLQLDQLDVVGTEQSIPQEIVDRCAAMNAKTETIQSLVESMNNLAEIISDVEHTLAECKALIQEETEKEKEYQKIMGHRPPSNVQTELSREFHKYQEAHARTNESNQVLHKAMTLHIANLRLLAQPLDQLEAKIPNINNIEGLDRETMSQMRHVVGKARQMQKQRETLIQQLRDELNADDITGTLLAGNKQPQEIFAQEIEKHTPKIKIIEQNLSAQENIINKMTSLYAAYGESRRMLTDVLRKRDGLINALITSYDACEELLNKSHKGLEFYRRLSLSAAQLLQRLKSTCQVQREERETLLANRGGRASATSTPVPVKSEVSAPSDSKPKLKDYLPYMKNRAAQRSVTPQVQPEIMPTEYYPETIYPTTVRPAPVGSEATADMTQYQDGTVPPSTDPRYAGYYPYSQPEDDSRNYGYNTPYTPQFSTQSPHTQPYNPYYTGVQDSGTVVTDSQSAPYGQQYAGYQPVSQAVNQGVNQGVNQPANQTVPVNQYPVQDVNQSPYNQYANQQTSQPNQYPNQYSAANNQYGTYEYGNNQVVPNYQTQDLTANFSQMQVTGKSENDYSQTYYSVQYPQAATPNTPNTYSTPVQNSNTSIVPSQVPAEYASLNYPYTSQTPNQEYSYATSSYAPTTTYPVYTNAETSQTNTVTVQNNQLPIDATDQPIKSHVSDQLPYYENNQQNTYAYQDQSAANYAQSYQNHPGYTFNNVSGAYEYNYGYQANNGVQNTNQTSQYTSAGSCETVQSPSETPAVQGETNMQNYYHNPYGYQTMQPNEVAVSSQQTATNYGAHVNQSTYMQSGQQESAVTYSNNQVSSPTEQYNEAPNYNQQNYQNEQQSYQNQTYQPDANYQNVPNNYQSVPNNYNAPNNYQNVPSNYQTDQTVQYQTDVNQSYPNVQTPQESTYKHVQNIQINYHPEQNQYDSNNQENNYQNQQTYQTNNQPAETYQNYQAPPVQPVNQPDIVNQSAPVNQSQTEIPEPKPEIPEPVSNFDLLSDIDFTLDTKPLMPEIKVPQISENSIKKPSYLPKEEVIMKPQVVEEVIERPPKRDLFADPSLMNRFTEEVKGLQRLVDSLTNKTPGGLTLLDSKWKMLQDVQLKENMNRSKTIAMQNSSANILTEVVPFDDSRVILKSDPSVYINASYYKQLTSWCVPLIISRTPGDNEISNFWRALLEKEVACIVCLQSEIEMQGKTYWPTAKGQSIDFGDLKVTLVEATCNVHWTERTISVASGRNSISVTHFQINVFPAKTVCAPLIHLAHRLLLSCAPLKAAWLHDSAGAGRSGLLAVLAAAAAQARAGDAALQEYVEAACVNLYKHRSNVLEDTKYLADAYRCVLFYAQGVLLSGTTMFNGESVAVPTGASVLPPVQSNQEKPKFSKESFEEMRQSPGMKTGDMKDPLNFLDPLWSLKKK